MLLVARNTSYCILVYTSELTDFQYFTLYSTMIILSISMNKIYINIPY